MNLSHKETDTVFTIMRELAGSQDPTELRQTVAPLVLRLFDAQYLASYVWNHHNQCFAERVTINMDDSNLTNYDQYFQFCDPITPILQRRRTATCVADIISRVRLEKTEFFNDFLARDGLHYGINFYAYAGDRNIGDLRIWRARHKEDFSRRDAAILDAIGAAFTQALLRCRLRQASQEGAADMDVLSCIERAGREKGLTTRQKEIASAILLGSSDRTIADKLCISLPTVRTHIQAIYQKVGVSGRTRLTRALLRY